MALPVINFAALEPQGNPGLRGIIPSIMEGLKLGYAPRAMSEDLEKQKLANALARINLETAPEMNQAELAYKQAQTPHMNAQTENIHANTGLTNLHSQFYPELIRSNLNHQSLQDALLREQLKYMPVDYALKLFGNDGKPNRWGAAFELNRSLNQMPAAARDEWIAQNMDEYTEMLNAMAQAAKEERENKNKGNPLVDSLANKYFPDLVKKEFQLGNEEQNSLLAQGLAKIGNIPTQNISSFDSSRQSPILNNQNVPKQLPVNPQMIPTKSGFGTTPEQLENLKKASHISANNKLTTAAGRNQYQGAIQVAKFFDDPEFRKVAYNASLYAGALNKGKAFADALSQKNPEIYTDYLSFEKQWVFYLRNKIKQLEGLSSTDKQRMELKDMSKEVMDKYTSNPDQFIIGLNNLGKSAHVMADAVYEAVTPLGGRPKPAEFRPLELPSKRKNNTSNENMKGKVKIISPSGKISVVPSDKVDEILKRYPGFMRYE